MVTSKIQSTTLIIAALFFFALPFLMSAGTTPDFFPEGEDANVSVNDLTLDRADVFSTVSRLINYALTFLGLVSLILYVYSGATWMLARGNQEEISRAVDVLKGTIIGTVIILSSYAISYFIFSQLADVIANTEAL